VTDRPGAALGNTSGDLLIETLVGSGGVEVSAILLNHAAELFEMQSEHVIQALSAQTADETLAKGIRWRCPRGCFEHLNTIGSYSKVRSEFAIPSADQVFRFCILGSGFRLLRVGNFEWIA